VGAEKFTERTAKVARVFAQIMGEAAARGVAADAPVSEVGATPTALSFFALSEGASRASAAAAFYELLVLKSWDVVDATQEPGGDIVVRKTDRFDATVAELGAR
jgi:hypothetical protein